MVGSGQKCQGEGEHRQTSCPGKKWQQPQVGLPLLSPFLPICYGPACEFSPASSFSCLSVSALSPRFHFPTPSDCPGKKDSMSAAVPLPVGMRAVGSTGSGCQGPGALPAQRRGRNVVTPLASGPKAHRAEGGGEAGVHYARTCQQMDRYRDAEAWPQEAESQARTQ